MKILHTEASPGWGGQERRILSEALGLRARGYRLFFAVARRGALALELKKQGFECIELSFEKKYWIYTLPRLCSYILQHNIQVINTHSSLDSWLGGICGRICGCKVVRTRHISNVVKKGLNSRLLYGCIPHRIVTTCEEMAHSLREITGREKASCQSIPTGLDPHALIVSPKKREELREAWGVKPDEIVVGTLCVLRGWKGVAHLLEAAKLLKQAPIKWVIVGDGPSRQYFHSLWKEMELEQRVIFTGYVSPPFDALNAMDIFTLLSWRHEGVSQAALQAAWLSKPLVTTPTGGLKEITLPGKTGILVPPKAPLEVAKAIQSLIGQKELCKKMGQAARAHVEKNFLFKQMLDEMERVFQKDA